MTVRSHSLLQSSQPVVRANFILAFHKSTALIMEPYYPLSDYALIGNGQTAALVNRQGSMDWCCWPRFDSAASFCRLLDAKQGGYFQFAPTADFRVQRKYIHATNVLETTFTTDSGVVRLTDFMPAPRCNESETFGQQDKSEDDCLIPHRLLRRVQCLAGDVELRIVFQPTFDFARGRSQWHLHDHGAIATSQDESLALSSPIPLSLCDDAVTGNTRVSKDDDVWFVLTHGSPNEAEANLRLNPPDLQAELDRTVKFWRAWASQCCYDGPYRELVLRSALVMKLLIFQPTGAVVAAPTTSLPDQIGGERNWDYRFSWLRDSGLLLDALQQLGYHDESKKFIDWLGKLMSVHDHKLRIMYCIDGQQAPDEHSLPHLEGYRESRPVRVGNGATDQTQIDIYGHIIDAVVLCFERMPREISDQLWEDLKRLADHAASGWKDPDHGPWEMRGEAKHYLYSKLYCWVGLDRVIRFAEANGLNGEIDRWKRQRDEIRAKILESGYNPKIGAFTQVFGEQRLDATSLTIPLCGFLPAQDQRVLSTMRRTQQRLSENRLVYRYHNDDSLPGKDATFTLCGFWMVMNLAMAGEHDEAVQWFEHLCGFANDLGLMSEQIDASNGDLLGNFPQGYTHLGLVRAALHLQESERDQND